MRAPSADGVVAVLVGIALVAVYVATLAPGLAYDGGDGHELTIVAATLGLAHPTGYPLYTWIGHLFTRLPVGEVAYRTNLMSAVLGGGSGALLFLVGRRLGLSPGIAIWTAVLHGVTTTFWSQAVITEVYAPNACMVALTLWLALRWADATRAPDTVATADRRFVLFALVYGLSFGTHMSNAGFAPFYALFVLLTDWRIVTRPRPVALGTLAFAVGLAQFAWLPLKARGEDIFPNTPPDTVAAFLAYTVRAFAQLRFAFPLAAVPSRVVGYVTFLEQNFTPIGVAFGLAGMWVLLQRDVARFYLLLGMYLVHVVVFSQMFVPDPEVFFVASNALFVLFIGLGADALVRAVTRAGLPTVRVLRPAIVACLCLMLATIARASYRDNDRSADTGLTDFHRSVFAYLPSGSVLVPKGRGLFGSDVTYWRRIGHLRPDVVATTERDAKPAPGAPVFVDRTRAPVGLRVPKGPLVPVIRGYEPDLILYRAESDDWDPTEHAPRSGGPEQDLHIATLVDLEQRRVDGDGPARIHVRAVWRPGDAERPPIVSTSVDGRMLEAHELGSGVLGGRTARAIRDAGRVIVDEFQLVLPSSLAPGRHALTLGTVELGAASVTLHASRPAPFDIE
jgi:hypothetical protein